MVEMHVFKTPGEMNKMLSNNDAVEFLYTHLGRFGDSKRAIGLCLDYALSDEPNKGGFVIIAYEKSNIAGLLIMNKTAMKDYIPSNILVYVAVHEDMRGKGLGSMIIKKAFEEADGDVKLHVEYDNPAKQLYERLGMTNKYAEMRYKKEN